MNIKQKGRGVYAAKKYSELGKGDDFGARDLQQRADIASMFLLKNGYVVMSSYAINEVLKLIRSLRELGIEYTMKTIESPNESMMNDKKWRDLYYEFTTVYLEDDRGVPIELSSLSSKALVNELKDRFYKTECKKDPDKRNFKLVIPSGNNAYYCWSGFEKTPMKTTETIIIHK